jgi:hypothetical protein
MQRRYSISSTVAHPWRRNGHACISVGYFLVHDDGRRGLLWGRVSSDTGRASKAFRLADSQAVCPRDGAEDCVALESGTNGYRSHRLTKRSREHVKPRCYIADYRFNCWVAWIRWHCWCGSRHRENCFCCRFGFVPGFAPGGRNARQFFTAPIGSSSLDGKGRLAWNALYASPGWLWLCRSISFQPTPRVASRGRLWAALPDISLDIMAWQGLPSVAQ